MVLLLLVDVVDGCRPHGLLYHQPLGDCLHVGVMGELAPCHHHLRPLEPPPSPQEGAIVKHVLGLGIQGPEAPLARITRLSGHLNKAVIETQVVANAILPLRKSLTIVGEPSLDELTDAVEGEPLVRGLNYGHGDQGDVGIGWLAVLSIFTKRLLKVIFCLNLDVVHFIFNLDAHVVGGNTGLIPSP